MRRTSPVWLIICLTLLVRSYDATAQQRSRIEKQSSPIEGFTEPFRRIDVAAADTGLITAIDVQEGAVVKEGQILARLDDLVLQAALRVAAAQKDATGQLKIAEAEYRQRDKRFNKLSALQRNGHATAEEVALAQSDKEVAEAKVQQARETLRVRQLEYERTQAEIERRLVRSPINGVVTRVFREPYEFVSYADPVVVTVVQLDPLVAVLTVYPNQIEGLKQGESVSLKLESTRGNATGEVTYISPVLDAESGTLRIKVQIDNKDGRYRAGDSCTLVTGSNSRIGSRPVQRK